MLLSADQRFAIPTATKTGTFSLESSLTKSGTFYQMMPRHAVEVPDSHHGATVLIMLRNPYARLVSMYTWGFKKKHSTLMRWGADGRDSGFDDFLRNWCAAFDKRHNPDWTTLLAQYVQKAQETNNRVRLFKLENDGVDAMCGYLRRQYPNVQFLPKRINTSAAEGSWVCNWTKGRVKLVGNRVWADLDLGDYKAP